MERLKFKTHCGIVNVKLILLLVKSSPWSCVVGILKSDVSLGKAGR